MLFVISLSNVATPVVYAAQLGKIHLQLPHFHLPYGNLYKSDVLTKAPDFYLPDHTSVLGASTTLFTVGTQKLDLRAGNAGSAHQRIPIRVQQLEKKVYQTTEDVTFAVTNPDNQAFTTTVQDADGKSVTVPITESNNGTTTTVDLAPSNEIKPGLYKVLVSDEENNSTEQDFTWGVLALNLDKTLYHPQETGDIAMAVLNDKGDMVCDAKVELRITNQGLGIDDTLSTTEASDSANKKITISPQCQKHDYSLEPDYKAQYQFGAAGVYNLQLSATTTNGTHSISDSIQVTDKIPFDVQRVSATRIYPPNTYPMTFNVTANRDFSGTVTETVPDSFTITPATQSASQSYTAMQTLYLNSNDPTAKLQQTLLASGQSLLVMPFQGDFPITQGFGAQLTDPTLQAFYSQYGLGGHDGIDFGLPIGTPLYAVDAGDVVWSGSGDYGTMVTIQHAWGKTYYGHMSNTSVTLGQHVIKGQLLGYSGMSGEATGPHLHFGMKPNNPDMTNGYFGKVDPMLYLPLGHDPKSILSLGPTSLISKTNVLGDATTDATSSGVSSIVSSTPTPSVSPAPTVSPTLSPSPEQLNASQSATVTQAPTPKTSLETTPPATPAANTNFTVLDKEIKMNEELANNAQTEKVKIITWKVTLKKGETTSLGYAYQTPKVSPEFYLLGPLKFYENGSNKVVFQEKRQWQLAADDVGVEWFNDTTGRQWNGYSWLYRKKITIDHTKVSGGSSLTDFPVLVSLSSDTDLSNNAQIGGNDILFTDSTGETLLPFEIESYSSGTLAAWIKISSLSASTDTILYMYYGNPAATSKANMTGTWNSNYVAVYHLKENAASKTISDSTSDGYNGTAARNTSNTTTTGEIDGAQSLLSASSDKVDIGDQTNLDFGNGSFTFFMWINSPNSNPGSNVNFWKGATIGTEQGYDLETTGGPVWKFHISDGVNGDYTSVTNTATNNTWENIAYVVDRGGGNLIPYLNGTAGTSASIPGGFGSVTHNWATSIGYDANSNNFFSQEKVDELEIYNGVLSAGWLKTEYNNQSSPGPGGGGFVSSLGSVETNIYAPTLGQLMRHGQWFNSEGQVQPFTF